MVFKIDGQIYLERHDSVKDFVFPCINRTVPRDSLSPYNLSLVEDESMRWTLSKQKLIADLHLKRNIVVHPVLWRWMLANGFKVTKIIEPASLIKSLT